MEKDRSVGTYEVHLFCDERGGQGMNKLRKDLELLKSWGIESIPVSKVLCMIEEAEGGSKISPIGQDTEAPSATVATTPVGGTIFYIDSTADGEYQFFDADGSVIDSINVGDKPYAYRVVKQGSKDKYYVYHDEIYDNLRWTYYEKNDYVYESLSTSKGIGSGKMNTEIAMAKDSGTYVIADSNRMSTIWYRLQQVRSDKGTGCDDWFVPSIDELELLRLAIKSGSITGGIIAGFSYDNSVFNNKWLWSSSEFLSQRAWFWYYARQRRDGGNKGLDFSAIFIRAF